MKELFLAIGLAVLAWIGLEMIWGSIIILWGALTEGNNRLKGFGLIVIGLLWLGSLGLAFYGIYRWVF